MSPACLLALAALLAANDARSTTIEFTPDSLAVVKQNITEKKAVLVDVRSEMEWNKGHLEGTIFLPADSLRKQVDANLIAEKLPKDKIVYTFCVVGMRAKAVAAKLEPLGYTVRPLKPGYEQLLAAGFQRGADQQRRAQTDGGADATPRETAAAAREPAGPTEPPTEWIDPQTGHRVVRLSTEPGSQSLYFHQNPFSSDGRKMVFTRRDGIYAVDLHSREVERVVEGRVQVLVTGRKSGDVYYIRSGAVHAANLATHESRLVADLPEQYRGGNVTVNADETLVVAIGRDPEGQAEPRTPPDGRFEGRLIPNWASGALRLLYTIDVASGAVNVIHRSHDWLNHLQCSPTDPQQIMFCHEGPWHFVDRVWLIRTDGTALSAVHPRTMDMEIAGHEFFGPDGRSVWYDLQTPRSMVFWLARYDLETRARTWYHVDRAHWSVHYNISPDGKLLAGDGGGPNSVANMNIHHERLDPPGNGQWIYLFRPQPAAMTGLPEAAARQVKTGVLVAERLVDLRDHDYRLEPNAIFTPDGKWIVFRSNMHGDSHVYMVEVNKAD